MLSKRMRDITDYEKSEPGRTKGGRTYGEDTYRGRWRRVDSRLICFSAMLMIVCGSTGTAFAGGTETHGNPVTTVLSAVCDE